MALSSAATWSAIWLVAAAALIGRSLNGSAGWVEVIIVVGGAALGLAHYVKYMLVDGPRTFSLAFGGNADNSARTAVVRIGESQTNVTISVLRRINIRSFSLVLSDTSDGFRRASVDDLSIIDVTDAGSPSRIDRQHKAPSPSTFMIELDRPIPLSRERALGLVVRVQSSQAWAGQLVFVSYDETGRRRTAQGAFVVR